MGRIPRRRAAAAALLAAAALGGCSMGPALTAVPSSPTGAVVSPVDAPSSPAASAPVSLPAPEPLPSGGAWISTAAHGVKFGVPAGWQMFDLSTFTDPAVRAALEPVAQKLGITVDAYIQQLTMQNDLIATGPERSGFSPTVSVRKEAALKSDYVPSKEEAQAQVAAAGGTVTEVQRLTTPLGVGYATLYTRVAADLGGRTIHCAQLGLPSARNTMFLAVVESDQPAERDALVHLLTATLQPA